MTRVSLCLMRRAIASIGCMLAFPLAAQQVTYTFDEARVRMLQHNANLKVAHAEVEIAHRERQRVGALWWPSLHAEGVYMHLSEKVEVRESLSLFTNPAKAYVQRIIPGEKLVTGLLDRVGEHTLSFPLLPRNIASVGLSAEWVAFSGGKRILVNRMAQRLTDVAEVSSQHVETIEQVELVERYYGLVLASQHTAVCHQRYEGLQHHYADALRMEEVGLIDKATRLFAQVAMEEAKREWQYAKSVEQVRQTALKQLLGVAEGEIIPVSPLFSVTVLPMESCFMEAMRRCSYTLRTLSIEERLAADKLCLDRGNYFPNIALFGKQTLYAHGLPSHLWPRTMVGLGFTWNLFDGLDRERKIAQTKLMQQTVAWRREDAEAELTVAVSELYAMLHRTMNDMRVLDATIALGEELLRIRRASFAEGMATSAEVVDAEDALAANRIEKLTAQYACNVTLANLLAICGLTEIPK